MGKHFYPSGPAQSYPGKLVVFCTEIGKAIGGHIHEQRQESDPCQASTNTLTYYLPGPVFQGGSKPGQVESGELHLPAPVQSQFNRRVPRKMFFLILL
jgi:hypothetical protein